MVLNEFKVPDKDMRHAVLRLMEYNHDKALRLAQETEYFKISHLAQLSSNSDLETQIEQIKDTYFPKAGLVEVAPDWDSEVGGLVDQKEQIIEIFETTQKYSIFFKDQKVSQGLLLYGPPGCGKTYLAAAIAKKFGMNFISVKGPELLDKYIGASEQNVRDLFEKAMSSKPSILFFDEFDSLVPKRGSSQSAVTDRIVNQFLCYLDGVEGRDGVFVMAATARPDLVDVALLRPGRIDKAVFCDFPSLEDREAILQVYLSKFDFEPQIDHFEQWKKDKAQQMDGFTSADIKGLVQNASLEKMSQAIKASSEDFKISCQDIDKSLAGFASGMTKQEALRYRHIYAAYQDRGSVTKKVGTEQQLR